MGIVLRTGRKWRSQEGLAESQLRHKALMDMSSVGWAGLAAIPPPWYDKARGKDRHHLVLGRVRWNTCRATAQQSKKRAATAGDMTRF